MCNPIFSYQHLKGDFTFKAAVLLRELNSDFVMKNLSRCMRFPTILHLTSVDSDEPLQPPFKLRNSRWCSVSSLTIIEYSRD